MKKKNKKHTLNKSNSNVVPLAAYRPDSEFVVATWMANALIDNGYATTPDEAFTLIHSLANPAATQMALQFVAEISDVENKTRAISALLTLIIEKARPGSLTGEAEVPN